MAEFMFATGIECSSPTIDGGRWRIDQLEETGHYKHWRKDLALVREIGLKFLRYGPPLHLIYTGPDKFDWSFTDEVFEAMRQLRIEPLVDLVHFGVPDWVENFQNPALPEAMAKELGSSGGPDHFLPAGQYFFADSYRPMRTMQSA